MNVKIEKDFYFDNWIDWCSGASKGKNVDASLKSDRWKFLDEGKLRKVSNRLFTDPASAAWYDNANS